MSFIVPFLAPLAMGISAVGTVASMAGSMQQGRAADAAARQQAAFAEHNAVMTEKDAKRQAAYEKEQYRKLGEKQKSAYAASGISLDSGSVFDTLAETDAEAERSAMEILYGGSVEAANYRNQAKSQLMNGQSAKKQGYWNAAGSLLGGAAQMVNMADRKWGG